MSNKSLRNSGSGHRGIATGIHNAVMNQLTRARESLGVSNALLVAIIQKHGTDDEDGKSVTIEAEHFEAAQWVLKTTNHADGSITLQLTREN